MSQLTNEKEEIWSKCTGDKIPINTW